MGQLRTKTIKGKQYFYYSVRSRSRRKYGGSGKVKSIDYCLGRYIYNDYQWKTETGWFTPAIAYYLWNGDISLTEFIEAHIRSRFQWDIDQLAWNVDIKRQKVRLRSKRGSGFDCRQGWVRSAIKVIELAFGAVPAMEEAIAETIVANYQKYRECLADYQTAISEEEKNRKQREFETAAAYKEWANSCEYAASLYFEAYQDGLNAFIKNAPRSIREEVRQKVDRRLHG